MTMFQVLAIAAVAGILNAPVEAVRYLWGKVCKYI